LRIRYDREIKEFAAFFIFDAINEKIKAFNPLQDLQLPQVILNFCAVQQQPVVTMVNVKVTLIKEIF
jgi:hypothetical protein